MIKLNCCQNAKIIRSKYEIERKIVENKQNHSVQTNKINMPSLEIQFSIRSFDTNVTDWAGGGGGSVTNICFL